MAVSLLKTRNCRVFRLRATVDATDALIYVRRAEEGTLEESFEAEGCVKLILSFSARYQL